MKIGQLASRAPNTTPPRARRCLATMAYALGGTPKLHTRREPATGVAPRARVDEALIITRREPPSMRPLCCPWSPSALRGLPPAGRLSLSASTTSFT